IRPFVSGSSLSMRPALTFAVCALITSSVTAPLAELPKAALDSKQLDQLIALLGSADFQQRERATMELAAAGLAALPGLRVAARSSDLEIVRRAKVCIEQIERKDPAGVLLSDLKSPDARDRIQAAAQIHILRFPGGDHAQAQE